MSSGSAEAKVRFSFQAEEEGELSVSVGDNVILVPNGENQEGWVLVKRSDGAVGFVPKDYLSIDSLEPNIANSNVQSPSKSSDTPKPVAQQYIANMSNSSALHESTNPRVDQISGQQNVTPSVFSGYSATAKPKINIVPPSPSTLFRLQSPLSTSSNVSTSSSIDKSVSALKDVSRLLQASKAVKNAVSFSKPLGSNPSVNYSVANSMDKVSAEELIRKNDEYFAKVLSSNLETLQALADMTDVLSKRVTDSSKV